MSLIVGIGIVFLSVSTLAQVDPSTAILLRSKGRTTTTEDLDNSRYKVIEKNRIERDIIIEPQAQKPAEEKSRLEPEMVVPLSESKAQASSKQEQDDDNSNDEELDDPKLTDQVRQLFLGGSETSIGEYRKLLHPLDYRRNLVEISLAAAYFYNDSGSNYWYRDYFMTSPGFTVEAKMWLTPFFGVHLDYVASLSAQVRGNPAGTKLLPTDIAHFSAGLRFRKFYGISRRARGFSFGVDFIDQQTTMPPDAQYRANTKTTGVRVSLEALMPATSKYMWTFGVHIAPKLSHEEGGTGIELRSGSDNETDQVGIHFGGRFTYDREHQLYWKLSHSLEKSLFENSANYADPISGNTPDGVAVSNGLTMFQFGYTIGH